MELTLYQDRLANLDQHTIKGKTFTATVVENRDPDKAGRLKVKIDGLTDKIEQSKLMWLTIKSSIDQSGNKSNSIPPVFSRVEVYCPTEDIVDAVIIGQINSIPPKKG